MGAKGLYRAFAPDGWAEHVCVDHGRDSSLANTVTRVLYEARRYKPPFDELPTRETWETTRMADRLDHTDIRSGADQGLKTDSEAVLPTRQQ